jgi:hypothetical protein
LKERFGRELHARELAEGARPRKRKVAQAYEDFNPGLRRLLAFAVSEGCIKREGFEAWRNRERVGARERDIVEAIARESGTEVRWEKDPKEDFVAVLLEAIPAIRNEHAHGTSALDPNVLGGIRTVCEIINQIYSAPAGRS